MTSHALDAALAAHAAGLCVVPPRQDGTKRPEGLWKDYQRVRPDETRIRSWYGNGRTGVGLVCGIVSGGLEMLEAEGRAVAAGLLDELDRLATAAGIGPLVNRIALGYCERTPSGGIHLLYRCPEIEGNLKLARDPNGEVLVETRGEGGFVIVAPSNGTVHPDGGRWELTDGGFDTIATITPAERTALLDVCRQLDQMPAAVVERPSRPLNGSRPVIVGDDTRPGDEFDAINTCDDVLLAHGFAPSRTDASGSHYTRPGKDVRHGSSATAWTDGTCTLFSSSIDAPDEYLDGHHKLSPWRLHVALAYRGDFAEAAREWRRDHPRALGSTSVSGPVVVGGGKLREEYLGPAVTSVTPSPPAGEYLGFRDPRYLPDEFWEARPTLAHIRQGARARLVGPDGVLGAILGRLAAFCPHTVDLPPIIGKAIGLTFYSASVGHSEAGKSAGAGVAAELLPNVNVDALDMQPIGSGEGYVEAMFAWDDEAKAKVQRWYGAYYFVDEGAVLGELSGRSGSTLLATLRSAFSHATIGANNAAKENKRVLRGPQYVYGFTMGIQPELAGPFLADAPAGTPQRFVYLRADDPTMTIDEIEWPGTLGWQLPSAPALEARKVSDGGWTRHRMVVHGDIRAEIRADRVSAQTELRPLLDAHRMLVRLKAAALLAILDGRLDVGLEDWRLAGIIMDVSRAVREGIEATLADVGRRAEEAANARRARTETAVAESLESRALKVMARAISRHVVKHDLEDGCPARCMTQATPGKYRGDVSMDDAISYAVSMDWLKPTGEHYKPGGSRPA